MTATLDVLPLAWDSEWLGFPVARCVAGLRTSADGLREAVAQARASRIHLLYLVVPPANASANAAALAGGAWLADHKRTYRMALEAAAGWVASSGVTLLHATELTAELRELALQSGEYSRFRRDARIGVRAFEELYTRWLHQTLERGTVWAATLAGSARPVGMLAFAPHAQHASIELLAVAPAARRLGLGQQLVQAARQAALEHGCATLQVVTQGTNDVACQFYERCGFRQIQEEHIYHLWL